MLLQFITPPALREAQAGSACALLVFIFIFFIFQWFLSDQLFQQLPHLYEMCRFHRTLAVDERSGVIFFLFLEGRRHGNQYFIDWIRTFFRHAIQDNVVAQ